MQAPELRFQLIAVGQQLDDGVAAFDCFDPALDVMRMAELVGKSTLVWFGKPCVAVVLCAMQHFGEARREAVRPLLRQRRGVCGNPGSFGAQLLRDIERRVNIAAVRQRTARVRRGDVDARYGA